MTEEQKSITELPDHIDMRVFDDTDTLADALASHVAASLGAALHRRGTALLAVSGGSTPLPFMRALSKASISWSQVGVLLVDERFVKPDSEDSNTRLVRDNLLQNAAAEAELVEVAVEQDNADLCALETNQRYSDLAWPLDACVLGMGTDGHTASLFPGSPELATAMAGDGGLFCCKTTPTGASHERITLTLPVIRSSASLILHIVGDAKLATLKRALSALDQVDDMPVRAVLDLPLTIYWCP